jgi:PAS domain S-box-containing protein
MIAEPSMHEGPHTLGEATSPSVHGSASADATLLLAGIREREALLDKAECIAEMGTWIWDLPTNAVSWSQQLFRILGYDPARDVASVEAWFQAIHPDDIAHVRAASERTAATSDTRAVPFRVRWRSGEVRECIVDGVPVRDADGRVVRIVGTVLDLTERRRVERELRRLEEDLLHSQKLDAIGRLAGGVAHDFNNMLTAILGHVELATRAAQPGALVLEHLQQVQAAAERAAGLTRQLLTFARKQVIQPVVLEPNVLVQDLVKLLRPLLNENIELKVLLGADVWPLRIDRGQFELLLVNLAVNARDAMPGGGRITIETENLVLDEEACRHRQGVAPGEYVQIIVTDTGHGMDAATRQHVFEPFFTTKAAGRGTGLGLATCQGIVDQHGGHIWFYSEPGRGTCFKICFPRAPAPMKAEAPPVHAPPARGSETILVVEDESRVRDLCARVLRAFGYRVLAAGTGREAAAASASHPGPIHLVVSDVMLPDLRGPELAAGLRRGRPSLRILYTSGYTENTITHEGVLDPGVRFLEKPYTPTQLAKAVRRVLDGG